MRWIVVFHGRKIEAAMKELMDQASACVVENSEPVPLDSNEITLVVDGPDDLNQRLKGQTLVSGVYPSSEMSLY
jgi:hypothetical protein